MGSRAHLSRRLDRFGTSGPRLPGTPASPGIQWTPDKDTWELYNLGKISPRPIDLAKQQPQKLDELVKLYDVEAKANHAYPIGGGLWVGLHPEFTQQNPATEFHYTTDVNAIPEASAPKLGLRSSLITIDIELNSDFEGVLYALGGFSGGLAAWIDKGRISFEYNLYEIERTRIETTGVLPTGRVKIEIESRVEPKVRNGAMDVTIRVNGAEVAKGRVPRTTGYAMSGNDFFDVGRDSYSPVSPAYYERAPFKFTGKLERLDVKYLPAK